MTEFRTQAIIVEYMIRNVDVFFDKNLASAAIAYYPEVHDVPLEAGQFFALYYIVVGGSSLYNGAFVETFWKYTAF